MRFSYNKLWKMLIDKRIFLRAAKAPAYVIGSSSLLRKERLLKRKVARYWAVPRPIHVKYCNYIKLGA